MRYGVLADIHGNLHALRAVLAVLEREAVDRVLVAGDLVGYGPDPNDCVATVAALGAVCVAGNHDLMALGRLPDDRCIPLARESLRWTRRVLGEDARAYLAALPSRAAVPGGVVVAHGSLDDPEAYTSTTRQAAAQLGRLAGTDAQVLVLGHTHRPLAVTLPAGRRATRAPVPLLPGEPALLNPGAVGQSRELRVRARCAVLDLDERRATFRAVPYDVAGARAALRAARLPPRSIHLRPSGPALGRRAVARVRGA